jgi:hypothetical protein
LSGVSLTETIAKEFKYHRSCYRIINRETDRETNREEIDKGIENEHREKCFEEFKVLIVERVIQDGEFIRVSALAESYRKIQQNKNLLPKGDIVRNLKLRLQNTFGDKITFFRKSPGLPKFIYGTNSSNTLIEKPKRCSKDLVIEGGKLIREELLQAPLIFSSWPPTENELMSQKEESPPLNH